MNASTWMLTIALAIGLLVSSTVSLCVPHADSGAASADGHAHAHQHASDHAHAHADPPAPDTNSASDAANSSASDICHHAQTPPLLAVTETPVCDLCTGLTDDSGPLLSVNNLLILPSTAIGPPLSGSPLERPPALPA